MLAKVRVGKFEILTSVSTKMRVGKFEKQGSSAQLLVNWLVCQPTFTILLKIAFHWARMKIGNTESKVSRGMRNKVMDCPTHR